MLVRVARKTTTFRDPDSPDLFGRHFVPPPSLLFKERKKATVCFSCRQFTTKGIMCQTTQLNIFFHPQQTTKKRPVRAIFGIRRAGEGNYASFSRRHSLISCPG
jgi:hypothetical protein